jgi:predicted nuclease of predicted toxin-antitoxin system
MSKIIGNELLIMKDSDFYNSFILTKKPPKLILVKLGNLRLRELKIYFRDNWNLIESHVRKYALIVLTQESIQVFE